MIYITQLIYLIPGKEDVFNQFEDVAIPIIAKYNGRLLLRIRPADNSVIYNEIETPYEIHFVQFESEQDFEYFKQDKERKEFLHLKEQSIRQSILVQGNQVWLHFEGLRLLWGAELYRPWLAVVYYEALVILNLAVLIPAVVFSQTNGEEAAKMSPGIYLSFEDFISNTPVDPDAIVTEDDSRDADFYL